MTNITSVTYILVKVATFKKNNAPERNLFTLHLEIITLFIPQNALMIDLNTDC